MFKIRIPQDSMYCERFGRLVHRGPQSRKSHIKSYKDKKKKAHLFHLQFKTRSQLKTLTEIIVTQLVAFNKFERTGCKNKCKSIQNTCARNGIQMITLWSHLKKQRSNSPSPPPRPLLPPPKQNRKQQQKQ